jgi:transposase InsO family protein
VVSYLHDTYRVSERRACRVARIPISTVRYESRQEPRTALRLRIREIAQVRVRYGYRKIRVLLNRKGWKVGKKLVYRLYKEEGLTLRHKPRRSVGRPCIAANASGQLLPTKCGVWISWPTSWQMAGASEP